MQPVSPLNRTAVFVENVERSAAFYLDVLGLELYATEEDLEPALLPDLLRVLGLEAAGSMRFRFLRSGEGREGLVALFEVTPPLDVPAAKDPTRIYRGEACLVFFHPDFDELLPRVAAAGCTILNPAVTLHLPTHEQREIVFRNEDGTLFNLIERRGTLVGVEPRVTQARRAAKRSSST